MELVGPLCTRLRGPQVVGGLFDLVGPAGGEGGVAAVAPPFGVEEEVVDGPKESARVALIGWKLRGYRVTRLNEIVLLTCCRMDDLAYLYRVNVKSCAQR